MFKRKKKRIAEDAAFLRKELSPAMDELKEQIDKLKGQFDELEESTHSLVRMKTTLAEASKSLNEE